MADRGTLIVIEGGDAAGKQTQAELLQSRLETEGRSVLKLHFPLYEDNQIGALIKEWLSGARGDYMHTDARVSAVLFAADRFETKPRIAEALAAGRVVILDRYTSASMLHQGAKVIDDADRKETIEWIYRLEHEIFGLPLPDALVYLEVPAAVRHQLLTKQWAANDRVADIPDMDTVHQQQVDAHAPGIMEVYPTNYIVRCAPEGELRSREDIHEEIYRHVCAILQA